MEVRTLSPDGRQSNLQDGKVAKERLFVGRKDFENSFGRSGLRRIVDVLWGRELTPNFFKFRLKIFAANAAGEQLAIAEQEGFKLVHQHERNESVRAENLIFQVVEERFLHIGCPFWRLLIRGSSPTGPSTTIFLRHTIVVHHGGRDAVWILVKVTKDIAANRGPRADAASRAVSGIADNSRGYGMIVARIKVRGQNLLDEFFFGLTFDVDQESHDF